MAAVLLGVALLWPSHTLSALRGVPLDTRLAAVLVGVVVPMLWLLRPQFLQRRLTQAAIVALLVLKVADTALLTQQGLCAKFSTQAPYAANVLTIPVEEPRGVLRSWDVRAGWRDESPACTAVVDRPYEQGSAFPAWFTNITNFEARTPRTVAFDVSGYARVRDRGLFVLETGPEMTISGRIGSQDVSSTGGRPMLTALEAGTHPIELHATLTGEHWRFMPTMEGRDAFGSVSFTTTPPRGLDRIAPFIGFLELALSILLLAGWMLAALFAYRASPVAVAWVIASAAVLAVVGATGAYERFAILLLAGAVLVPVAEPHRTFRGALLFVGVPWLALIVARSLPQVAHFTSYSNDDWLAYQVAGYRIFMHGFWLEGGSKAFDYQPLYRWLSGALHLVFGDSSVGETFWDAFCLLAGAGVAFALVDRAAGFKWGVAAAVGTLATFWLGTIWYFVGRGLSEIAAAGWGFIAALLLLRNRSGDVKLAAAAGVFAVLMFYTRLNHLLFAAFLAALLPRIQPRAVAAYLGTFAAGIALFATRTWWYTGAFSILYGTSLKNNDTGLRLTTMASADVWSKVWHSLRALVWMNEPPAPDPRAILVVAGALLSIAVVLHLPKTNRLPMSVALVTLGACVSSLLAHTHNYPGRMSIHLAPFAVAMTATAGARLLSR